MARKDKPWQAEFNQEDKARIVRWLVDHYAAWDRWGRQLERLEWWKGRRTERMTFAVSDFQDKAVHLAAAVGPRIYPAEVRKAFRVLGLPYADAYINAARDYIDRNRPAYSEDEVFESIWLSLSHGGAGTKLEKILTEDKAAARRWKATLKKEGKTWANVRLSTKAAAEIAEAMLKELETFLHFKTRKDAGPLRTRFRRYIKKYFPR